MLKQSLEIIRLNFLMLPARAGSSLISIIGIACVVAVFIGLFSIADSFRALMLSNSDKDTLLVLRQGANAEVNSSLDRDTVNTIGNLPGIAVDAKGPLFSPELTRLLSLPQKTTGELVNVNARGVTQAAYRLRDGFELQTGRLPETGRNELLVGRAAQDQFAGLAVGDTLRIADSPWEVVGVFASNGGAVESELWTDLANLQSAFNLGNAVQSMRLKLEDPGMFEAFRARINGDQLLNAFVQREADFIEQSSQGLLQLIRQISVPLVVTMALGAVFAALNTMYSSVASRTREIATLRAIGFNTLPIGISVFMESMFLALAGALVGAGLIYFGLNGHSTNTNLLSDVQYAFTFVILPALVFQGIFWALVLGFLGGLFPAIRAGRMSIVNALRAL
jgi:putative ABC transport system permease protein